VFVCVPLCESTVCMHRHVRIFPVGSMRMCVCVCVCVCAHFYAWVCARIHLTPPFEGLFPLVGLTTPVAWALCAFMRYAPVSVRVSTVIVTVVNLVVTPLELALVSAAASSELCCCYHSLDCGFASACGI
jgi:hypothetical protein